jgi:magnesium transporter
MIEARRYRTGVADPEMVDCSDLTHSRQGPGTLLIVELVDFSQQELQQVATELAIHPLAVEDLETATQQTKLQQYGDHWHVAVHQVEVRNHHIFIREVDVVFGADWLLAVRQPVPGDLPMDLDEVRERFRRMRMLHPGNDIGYALWALLDVIVDGYFDVTDSVDDRIDQVEDDLFDGATRSDQTPKAVFDLRRKLVRFRRAVKPLREVLGTMTRGEIDWIEGEAVTLLRDVNDHTLRVADTIDSQRELLNGLLDAHLALVSNRMNDVMKKTSSYGAILLVSTLIAGIYGMNFEYMPELDFKYGYFVALGFMVIATVILWWRFKKRGWL